MVSVIYFSFYTYFNISTGLKIIHYKPFCKLLPPLASIPLHSLCFLPLFGCIPCLLSLFYLFIYFCLLSLILFPDHWKHISMFILQPILNYSSIALFSLDTEFSNHFSQSVSSVTHSCPTLCEPMDCSMQASLSITNSRSLLRLMSIELVMPSNHLILCCLLPFHPQSFPASGSFQISQFFSSRGQSIGASASASVLPMNIQD